jgi:hypothetical protein
VSTQEEREALLKPRIMSWLKDLLNSGVPGEEEFWPALLREDDLGAVVRTGAHVEHHLRLLIEMNLTSPEEVRWKDVTLDRRIELAIAAGRMPRSLKRTLKQFAELRNLYAHNLDVVIDNARLDKIVDGMSPGLRKIFNRPEALVQSTATLSETQYKLRRICVAVTTMLKALLILHGWNRTVGVEIDVLGVVENLNHLAAE